MPQELLSPSLMIFIATLLAAVSGIPMLFSSSAGASRSQITAVALSLISSCIGLAGSVLVIISGQSELYQLAWSLPFGEAQFGVDPLSAWFLLPIFLVTGCSALYARSYWHADHHPATVRKMTLFFGLMSATMSSVVLARDGITFLFAWEIMALAAYFLVSTEDEKPEVNEAGTLYIISSHTGSLALFALFPLLYFLNGSWLFPKAASLSAATPLSTAVFLAALFAFGLKAGLMPLHIWLPSAHANAPSHISAAMSGVILKVGIYGLVRTLTFFQDIPLWWGYLTLMLGVISGLLGVIFALGQHDLKRLLAYHSIENIGIIVMGLGVALIGQSTGSSAMMLLGMAGALLHVLNHATFKALLFLSAGSVIHACGTRELDLLGGVSRRLPRTALLFGIGAVAICGLPPLNGFVSELLVYLGLFRGIQGSGIAAASSVLAAPALAMVGGLAVACFVKVYGLVFLGVPRAPEHAVGKEAGWQMLLPMSLLALVCASVGLAPVLVSGLLQRASLTALPQVSMQPLSTLFPLTTISLMGAILLLLLALIAVWYRRRLSSAPIAETTTWGCGYQRPTPRMQYSASSFAQMLTSIFSFVLRPKVHHADISGVFPATSDFQSHVPEAVLELVYIPALNRLYRRFSGVRKLQGGILQQYVLYILLTLILLLVSDYL